MCASTILEEAPGGARRFGFKTTSVVSLRALGLVVLEQGDAGRAATLFADALALCRETVDRAGSVECLEGAGATAIARSLPRLIGAADALRCCLFTPMPPADDRPTHERALAAVRDTLGEDAFASTRAAGRAMTLEQAVGYALNEQPSA